MRSESCSFIWQPKVVTWNAFTAWRVSSELRIEGGSRGARFRAGVASCRYATVNNPTRPTARRSRRAGSTASSSRDQLHALGFDRRGDRAAGRERAAAPALPRRLRRRPHGAEPQRPLARRRAGLRRRRGAEPPERRGALGHPSHRRGQDRRHRSPYKRGSEHRGDRRASAAAAARARRRTTAIPVTTPGRTLADLATALPRRPLEKAVEMAEALQAARRDRRRPPRRRAADARSPPRRPRRRPRAARSRTRSSSCATRHGIPRPLVNTRRRGLRGRLLLAGPRLIVETDGREHHGTRAAFERDRARTRG